MAHNLPRMSVTATVKGTLTMSVEPFQTQLSAIQFIRAAAMRGGWIPKAHKVKRLCTHKDPNP